MSIVLFIRLDTFAGLISGYQSLNQRQNMKTLKFKTNIHCSGCVRAVTPFLNGDKGISQWEVDTQSDDKILTVQGDQITADTVVSLIEDAGFSIEPIQS